MTSRYERWLGGLIVILAGIVALVSARSYAGAWYDGSRLATVECLVDRHTLAIDDSVFVKIPPLGQPSPYPDEPIFRNGTGDKLFIDGHYYSDKSPVPALLMAAVYQVWQWCAGITVERQPAVFCYGMTLVSSGLPYVIAVWCIFAVTGIVGLSTPWRLLLTASFALATVAPTYTQHVNNHILLLGVVAALFLCAMQLARESEAPAEPLPSDTARQEPRPPMPNDSAQIRCRDVDHPHPDPPPSRGREQSPTLLPPPLWGRVGVGGNSRIVHCYTDRLALVIAVGLLTGLGYSIDLGAGPVLFLCALAWVAYRLRSVKMVMVFVLSALPFMALHHAVNYAVGGTFKPANAVPEYFNWPGCSFSPQNMTGSFNHTPAGLVSYSAALLFGKRGFVGHNLPLFLAIPGLVLLLRRRPRELPEILFAACWSAGTWLAYAVSSNNSSGVCCSIRWFVPLLAPGFLVLALCLRDLPCRRDFLVLTGWGAALSALMCWYGPWINHMVPLFWPIQAAALLTWAACRWRPAVHPAHEQDLDTPARAA